MSDFSMITLRDKRNHDYTLQIVSGTRDRKKPYVIINCKHSHPAYGSSYLEFKLDQNQINRLKESLSI